MPYLNGEDDDYHLNNVISNKYIPQRQSNPYLKKYYAGRRPLPWRLSKLSSWVTGCEWDLKDYEDWLWEEDKKAKVKAQRREERQRRFLEKTANTDNVAEGHEDISTTSRKRIKLAPSSPTTDDLKTKTGSNSKSKTNTELKKRKRPQTPHLISAIKATSKRRGYLGYYAPCCCCYSYDRPRILKSQDFRRSLAMLLSEHTTSSSSSLARPKNPQSGRARFHEGRDKAWEQKRQQRPNDRWGTAQWGHWFRYHDAYGGRGLRGWMREERRRRAVPLGDPVDENEGAEWFGLGDITREGEAAPYRVRYIVAQRSRGVESGNGLTLGPVEVVDEPFYWGSDMEDMEDMEKDSDGESDVWVQEEWVCLSIDGGAGSADEMTLSWIEVDDDFEDDDF